jgi:hypothetical protein
MEERGRIYHPMEGEGGKKKKKKYVEGPSSNVGVRSDNDMG